MAELADSMDSEHYIASVNSLAQRYQSAILIGHNPAISEAATFYAKQFVSMSAGDYKIIKL